MIYLLLSLTPAIVSAYPTVYEQSHLFARDGNSTTPAVVQNVISDKSFVIAMCVTAIVLFAIAGPLLALAIYYLRHRSSDEEDDRRISVVPSMKESIKPKSSRRDSYAARSIVRNSMASEYSVKFPSTAFPYSGEVAVDDRGFAVVESAKPPPAPFDRIKIGDNYVIEQAYVAKEFDEMTVNEGNTIHVVKVYDDGWVLCVNQETNNKGVVPSDCFSF